MALLRSCLVMDPAAASPKITWLRRRSFIVVFYAGDQWLITPRLTLNYGAALRADGSLVRALRPDERFAARRRQTTSPRPRVEFHAAGSAW